MEKAVIELGPRDFSQGLSFVAVSRVKSLKGLAFQSRFEPSCLQKPDETETVQQLREDNEHCKQLGFELNTYGMDLSEYQFF